MWKRLLDLSSQRVRCTQLAGDIYKIYVESFRGEAHLRRIVKEAQAIVDHALASAG